MGEFCFLLEPVKENCESSSTAALRYFCLSVTKHMEAASWPALMQVKPDRLAGKTTLVSGVK